MAGERRTYRMRRSLRVAVDGAMALWSAVAALLLGHPQAGGAAAAASVAFVTFFSAYAAVYDRRAVVVTPDGFVFHSLFRSVPVRSDEILAVRVVRALGSTSYAVLTPRGRFRFTSLIERHRELRDVLLARAGLTRRAA